MPLEQELQTYQRTLPDLFSHEGQFVVIAGDEVAGTWSTYREALQAGYDRYALRPFLVKQIRREEQPRVLLQDIRPPCLG
jgi:hypothetical protein